MTLNRWSTKPGDPGYQIYKAITRAGAGLEILLDGKPVDNVFTADADQAFVDVYKTNERREFYIEPGTDSLAWERIYGLVELQITVPRPGW